MGYELHFDVLGEREVSRAFSRFADNVNDFRGALKAISYDFHTIATVRQFQTEGAYSGQKWQPLSDDPAGKGYATWKARAHPGAPILVLSGEMRRAATDPARDQIGTLEAKLVIDSDIAIYHQRGTKTMPARPIIRLTEADKDRWSKTIHRWLIAKAKEDGLL